jgi:hypothetical protein
VAVIVVPSNVGMLPAATPFPGVARMAPLPAIAILRRRRAVHTRNAEVDANACGGCRRRGPSKRRSLKSKGQGGGFEPTAQRMIGA